MTTRYTRLVGQKVLLTLLFIVWASQVWAKGIITIKPQFFHVDAVKNIVLINAPLRQLRAAADTLTGLVLGNRQYVLSKPLVGVSARRAYRATANGVSYTVFFTQVPVIQITAKQQITDSPSVPARLVLADTSGITAQSAMGIEFRGSYSQSFPKKSYELSLWADSLGTTSQDLSLLGMRTDNKWNLQALYNDPLRLRMNVANELWQQLNQLYYQAQEPSAKNGIALAYAEVFLNGSYQGIYSLTERVDRKQLKLKKYTTKIMGELYKGVNWGGGTTFNDAPGIDNSSLSWAGFEYKEPTEQTNWTGLHDFVNFVVNSSNADFYSQYQRKFRLDNAVDYFIFLNLLRATDNTGKNIYIAKYKPGEPYYYVPWDLDGVLGDDWQGLNAPMTTDILSNGFYDRLLKDNGTAGFRAALASRWATLRVSLVTKEAIMARIKQKSDYLLGSDVYEREQLAWPDYHYDPAQLAYPADWLTNRLAYLDTVFGASSAALGVSEASRPAVLQLYPNPASGSLLVQVGTFPCQLLIEDVSGRTVRQLTLTDDKNVVDISSLARGLYIARIKTTELTAVQKLVIN